MSPILPTGPLLPVLVFVAETCVLTIATIRTIFIARGRKGAAAVLGFGEVSIWLFAIGQVMQNLSNPLCSLGFAAGFSLGNFLGILIDQKLAIGSLKVQITTHHNATPLIESLRAAGYGVTKLDGRGATGPVEVIVTVVPRKELPTVAAIIERFDADAFYSVQDLQSAAEGVTPRRSEKNPVPSPVIHLFRMVMGRRRSATAV
jgi:uncharacterized protein YebE (UPF0316 family)